ncbi:MAG: hypothetical protein IT442_01335 [Phycisphaeraceae bacterium]|nr:hypothetical protein [Phycisphaeraceae bacterium]
MTGDDPLQPILDKLDAVRKTPNGFAARCPAHDDTHASLSVSRGTDGRVLLHCHAGCSPMAVCQAMGLRLGDLFPRASERAFLAPKRIVATYDYRDAAGKLLFQVVRFEPKAFRQRRPVDAQRGNPTRGWIWNLEGVPRVLYRLPELLAAARERWVFVVEGEKDADRLASLGLIATTCPQGAGKWSKLADDSALQGRRVAVIPDGDATGLAHAQDVIRRLTGKAAELRLIHLPGGHKDVSDWLDAGGTVQELMALVEKPATALPPPAPPLSNAPPEVPPDARLPGDRPTILIDTEEHRVVGEAIAALTVDPDVYQRGAILVRVVRDPTLQPRDGIVRCQGSPTIQSLPPANLRERLTRHATFVKVNRRGEQLPAHPAAWLVSAIDARGEWPGIRPLVGVSDAPVLRPDGSVWQTPGYDDVTGVLFEPQDAAAYPAIHREAGQDDAEAAVQELLEAVCDFPFESPEHQAAWLAALLTPLARFAYAGPSPLFLIDANIRGAGKGLLAQTIGRIVLGREMPVSSYAHEAEEMRKKITAIAIAGDRMILLDNLEGLFGNDAIDRALTSTRWKDRLLGKSEEVELPLIPAWYATGNNVQVAADTARRIIHIRLDVLDEHPEHRSGFRHANLAEWIQTRRPRLLTAALTILSAYLRRGTPAQTLTPFGSFEGWSSVVRQAVVWSGLADPCATRARLAESADTTADALGQLIGAWREIDPFGTGIVVSDLLSKLYPSQHDYQPRDAAATAMRAALENLVGCPPGRPPTPRQVGNRLRGFRRRVVQGVFLDFNPSDGRKNGAVWKLMDAR